MARKPKAKGYGNGGIYPDSERPGHWRVRVPWPDGRVRQRRAATREKAEAAYAALIEQRDAGLNPTAHRMTLEQFVNLWWTRAIQPRVQSGDLAPKTQQDYRRTLEGYVLPDWGRYSLESFDAPRVIHMFYAIRDEYSHAMADRALRKLHLVFDAARRWKYLKENPVADARRDLPAYHADEAAVLTLAECQQLLAVVAGHRLELAYHLFLIYGLRIAELCGLQWSDIDWHAQTLLIQRQVQQVTGAPLIRATTKTRSARRVLPIPPRLYQRLADAYRASSSLFVIPNDEGGLLKPSLFNRHFSGTMSGDHGNGVRKRIIGVRQKAGLSEDISPHSFRHTVGTMLKELAVSEETRADIFGHSKRSVTQEYSHRALRPMLQALTAWEQELLTDAAATERLGS